MMAACRSVVQRGKVTPRLLMPEAELEALRRRYRICSRNRTSLSSLSHFMRLVYS